jgi:hypothetical protein
MCCRSSYTSFSIRFLIVVREGEHFTEGRFAGLSAARADYVNDDAADG